MPSLKWDKYEVLECLEVAPEIEEYEIGFLYKVVQEKLTLHLMIWQFDSVVEISMLNTDNQSLVMTFSALVRGGIYRKKYKNFEILEIQDCIIVSDRFYSFEIGDLFDKKVCPYGITLEVSIKPEIHIKIIGVGDSHGRTIL